MVRRAMTKDESVYCYTQSAEFRNESGLIGHLRADFGSGEQFYSSWWGFREELNTGEFKKDIDFVINGLREKNEFLASRKKMAKYCREHPEGVIYDDGFSSSYGVRVDTEKYVYMMRLNPMAGTYNLYCYCYVKDVLDEHIRKNEVESEELLNKGNQ